MRRGSIRTHELIKICDASWYWEGHQHPPLMLPSPPPHSSSSFYSLTRSYSSQHWTHFTLSGILHMAFFSVIPWNCAISPSRTIKVEVYDWDRDGRSVCLRLQLPGTAFLVPNICFLSFFPFTGASLLSFVTATTSSETIRPATESLLEGRVSLMYTRWVCVLIPLLFLYFFICFYLLFSHFLKIAYTYMPVGLQNIRKNINIIWRVEDCASCNTAEST